MFGPGYMALCWKNVFSMISELGWAGLDMNQNNSHIGQWNHWGSIAGLCNIPSSWNCLCLWYWLGHSDSTTAWRPTNMTASCDAIVIGDAFAKLLWVSECALKYGTKEQYMHRGWMSSVGFYNTFASVATCHHSRLAPPSDSSSSVDYLKKVFIAVLSVNTKGMLVCPTAVLA